jgi:hypothetical protein
LKAQDCNPLLDEDAQGWLLAPLHRKTACTSVTPKSNLFFYEKTRHELFTKWTCIWWEVESARL